MTLKFWKIQARFFYKVFLKLDLCNVSLWLHSGWTDPTEGVCPSQVSYPEVTGAHLSFICDSKFDQPGKCCQRLQSVVMIFSLCLISSLWEEPLRPCNYPIPLQPPLDVITDGSCLKQSLFWWFRTVIFLLQHQLHSYHLAPGILL